MASGAGPASPGDGGERRKKQLQQLFTHANKLVTQGNHDYAGELLTQCVLGDPSNTLYGLSFLANLRQKYNNNKKGSNLAFIKSAGARGMVKKATLQKDWNSVIRHGLDLLKLNPWDVSTLTALASACDAMEMDDAEMAYLKAAWEVNPADPDINRLCAAAYRQRQQFDEAIGCWRRVLQASKGDMEAAREIHALEAERTIFKGRYEEQDPSKVHKKDIRQVQAEAEESTPEELLERQIKRHPQDLPRYIELADLYLKGQRLDKVRDTYLRALEISPGNEDIQGRLQSVELDLLNKLLAEAERTYKEKGTDEAKSRLEERNKEFETKHVEVLKSRVDRFPSDFDSRYELSRHYMRSGMLNEAIQELQKARNEPRLRGVCVLALGQCFMQKKQYRLAMSQLDEAINLLADREHERKEALWQAARLAYGLKDYEAAEKYATTLAGLDFGYKEVATLLDKIAQKREDNPDLE